MTDARRKQIASILELINKASDLIEDVKEVEDDDLSGKFEELSVQEIENMKSVSDFLEESLDELEEVKCNLEHIINCIF